ncbi:Cellulose biosynthesis protein BcsQ [Halomicrobium zhouii]|uniref:Cellulose biosynthesis protein BcsQ n=1 Tax=Halomicrobium zhouii TaxID=767519 RepID=A0A1I6K709_9EURY|nr:cellulose synthase operon protein YhjQ/BcsQ [Halomicrobium zhouii]SFR86848.1 Cellulose biosynthesis protein BcsQ [Halomicrobium zhouii]
MSTTVAFVGVTGGAGTTRLSVEAGATLARAGHSVAVLDAAFATQGLATHVEGRIDPDLTRVLTDEAAFGDALVDVWPDLEGRAAIAPVHAPFERVARAKAPDAARQFETCVDHAARQFDHVVVDVPPVADNQSVAAVTGVDRRVLVAPDARRGADLLPRMRGRLVDLGSESDALVANRAGGGEPTHLPEADHVVPTGEDGVVTPTCATANTAFAVAVADLSSSLFDRDIEVDVESGGLLG